MQKHPLLQFIESRLKENTHKEEIAGPVITISREYGCPGYILGNKLAETFSSLNSIKGGQTEWKALNREILTQAANEIHLPPAMVDRVIHLKPHSVIEDLFSSFTDHYVPNDFAIKKTVAQIIQGLALEGNIIIVGRAGVVLTQEMTNSLHIHLQAPLKWRLKQVMEREHISEEQAKKIIQRVDQERIYIRNFFAGHAVDNTYFDAVFNTERLSTDVMRDAIITLARGKGLIR
jgi:cytidylate kinase